MATQNNSQDRNNSNKQNKYIPDNKFQDSKSQNNKTELQHQKTSAFTRIFAIIGLIIIAGLYILSLVAALSDWENSFGIFTGALAATIFVPIVIYLFKLFSNRDNQ